MKGHIRQRSKGLWEITIDIGADPSTGRRKRALVGKLLADSDFVFCRPDGNPLDPGTVRQIFRRILCRAGLRRIRFHDLRHSHATLMLVSGVYPKVVQERQGHGSVAITLDTYSHVLPGMQEAAVRRLDELLDLKLSQTEDVGKMSAKGNAADR